jgi:hypothetical protein
MAAAPQYATAILSTNGGDIAIDMYLSDVVGANGNFDSGNSASSTSHQFWTAPASGFITDFSIKTGMTDTTCGTFTVNGSRTKSTIRWANHLNTMALRPPLNIPINAGEQLSIIQLA